jgi:hypothetical protein
LHAVALVDLALAGVVLPDNAELDDALRDGDDLEGLLVLGVLLEEGGRLEGGGKLCRQSDSCSCVTDAQLDGARRVRTPVGLLKLRLAHCVCEVFKWVGMSRRAVVEIEYEVVFDKRSS